MLKIIKDYKNEKWEWVKYYQAEAERAKTEADDKRLQTVQKLLDMAVREFVAIDDLQRYVIKQLRKEIEE